MCRFLESKNVFDVQLMHRLFKAIMGVVFATECDWETQSNWISSASEVLSAYNEEMRLAGITLDWKEYWNLLERKYTAVRTVCNDGDIALKCFVEVHTLCKQVRGLEYSCLCAVK
jgi:hypothetical protein